MKTINDLKNIKSLIIRGSQNSGKSTTIQEVCKQLNCSEVYKLNFNKKILKKSTVDEIFNGTYIIYIGKEVILIIAGAPTEQKKSIRIILELCIELQIEISFVLSARRFAERNDFNTTSELKRFTTLLNTIKIEKISGDFRKSEEWQKRIKEIVTIIQNNLKGGVR
ncbi:MAG: hypothetical protein LBG80_07085 [Bacteroidales bacterium]|jgi:nicotinamide riboside kinase|nr:hypothetical protein [Bacteroidales bacterium]